MVHFFFAGFAMLHFIFAGFAMVHFIFAGFAMAHFIRHENQEVELKENLKRHRDDSTMNKSTHVSSIVQPIKASLIMAWGVGISVNPLTN
jgi:hypothetical protein